MSGSHPLWRRGRLGDGSRRAKGRGRQVRRVSDEQAQHEAPRPRGAGREQALPAVAPQRLADALEGAPRAATGSRRLEAYPGQPVGVAKVGNTQCGNAKTPHVARQGVQRWQAALGEVAVPLGPERVLVAREEEGIDDRSALPAVVRRRDGPGAGIGVVGNMPKPDAGRIECPGFERQGSGLLDRAR